jgi:hypothetical protein
MSILAGGWKLIAKTLTTDYFFILHPSYFILSKMGVLANVSQV